MRKTPTIFDRDWEGNRGVVPRLLVSPGGAYATEKLDGTNVRVTVRSGTVVRLEKRRNPDKEQKARGITEPWYVDAAFPGAEDRYIHEALDATRARLSDVPDGEWSAEAIGPKIQGNPYELDEHRLIFFDRGRLPGDVCVPVLADVPPAPVRDWGDPRVGDSEAREYFDALRAYMDDARSAINRRVGIEGIVWHGSDGWAKLKRKDFK